MISGKVGRSVVSVAAALAITLGTTIVVGVAVVRRQLVQERFYQAALVHNDVYNRIYSEVLTDPELHDVAERLVGNVHGGVVDPASARIFTTNALHLVLPPSRLQSAVEQLLAAVLAYIRGDTAHLAGDVDVHEIVTNVHDAAIEYARSALAAARP